MEEEEDVSDSLHSYSTPTYSTIQLTIMVNISWLLSQKQNFDQDVCQENEIFLDSPHDFLI